MKFVLKVADRDEDQFKGGRKRINFTENWPKELKFDAKVSEKVKVWLKSGRKRQLLT